MPSLRGQSSNFSFQMLLQPMKTDPPKFPLCPSGHIIDDMEVISFFILEEYESMMA